MLTDEQIHTLFRGPNLCPKCQRDTVIPEANQRDVLVADARWGCRSWDDKGDPSCDWEGTVRDLVEYALERAGITVRRGTNAEHDVLAERAKQRERWSAEHDDTEHADGMLAHGAAAILLKAGPHGGNPDWVNHAIEKHAENPRQRLVVVVALLIAEIDRLDRANDTSANNEEREYVRLSGAGDEWSISADPLMRVWDSAADAMAEIPGGWWEEEPGYWLCDPEELDDFLSDDAPGRQQEPV